MASTVTLSQLLAPTTAAQYEAQILAALAAQNPPFPTTAWQPGSVPLSIIKATENLLAAASSTVAQIAQGGFTTLSVGDWLTLLALNRFGLARLGATQAVVYITLTASNAASSATKPPGSITIGWGGTNGAQYQFVNLDQAVITPGASTQAIRFTAVSPGSAYNPADNATWTLITAIAGVTATNPAVPAPTGNGTSIYKAGADAQPDASLTADCNGRWGTLGAGANDDQYTIWAKQFGGGSVTRVGVSTNAGAGTVTVTAASSAPGGNPGSSIISQIQSAINPLVPDCVQCVVQAPTQISVRLNGIVRCLAGYQDPGTSPYLGAANAAAATALTTYAAGLAIGGEALGLDGSPQSESFGVPLSRVIELIEAQTGVQSVLSTTSGPPGAGFFSIVANSPTPPYASVDAATGDLVLQPGQLPSFSWTSGPGASLPFVQV